MGAMEQLTASDGHHLGAYRATPQGRPLGALVIIQEIFGVNNHIRATADSFAAEGYVCIAPALFDRVKPNVELDYDAAGLKEGLEIRMQLNWDDALKDVQAANKVLQEYGKVGIVGYCFGGSVAWLSATRLEFACAVSYYGGAVVDFADEKPTCPTICHIGGEDHSIPAEKIEIIGSKRPEVTVYVYEGAGHGFNCEQRGGAYNEGAASLALERTHDFLRAHVGGLK